MQTQTHQIISIVAGKTQNSSSPMYRCQTLDGERVNVFKHADPKKDSFHLFADAGYSEIGDLDLNEVMTWKNSPIGVVMGKSADGKWWEVREVVSRPDGVMPDPVYVPDLGWYSANARMRAGWLLEGPFESVFFDTETTGTDRKAEIISLAILDCFGGEVLKTLIQPQDFKALESTTHVHGLSEHDLIGKPTFPEVANEIRGKLDGIVWVAYNANFDYQMIEQNFQMYGMDAPICLGLHDAMLLYSQWAGKWDKAAQRWENVKLQDAAQELGIAVPMVHDAAQDAKTLYALVSHIAATS